MTYKTGSWGEQARAKYKRRKESGERLAYFREYRRQHPQEYKYKPQEYKYKPRIAGNCVMCDSPRGFYHHINGNHDDNDKKNLMIVCRGCHNKVHIRNPKGGKGRDKDKITRDQFGRFIKETR